MEIPLSWQVESLRFTLFHMVGSQPICAGLWEKLTGQPPETRTEKPTGGALIEEGEWLDHRLVISTQLGRVDVIFHAAVKEPSLPNGGEFLTVVNEIRKIFPDIGVPVMRLAFGATLVHPEPDQLAAYDTLRALLSTVTIRPNTRELMYQLNLPVQSKLDSLLEINRISRWNAVRMQFMTMQANVTGTLDLFATRLEIDISTPPDVSINNQSLLPALADEMIANAIDISRRGDQL